MHLSRLILICCFLWSSVAYAGRLERAWVALKQYDYFKARKLFLKELHQHKAGAAYGLAIIFSRKDNPFHDVWRAHHLIEEAVYTFPKEGSREYRRLAKLSVTKNSIDSLRSAIDFLGFQLAKKQNDLDAWTIFIDNYCHASDLVSDAVVKHNHLAFEAAQRIGTWQAYRDFLSQYPDAADASRAGARYERLLYETTTHDSSVTSYEIFLREHPQSPYVHMAEDAIYRLTTTQHTAKQYELFVAKYPENRNVSDAWQRLYALSTSDYSNASITAFLNTYPAYPFRDKAGSDLLLTKTHFYAVHGKTGWGFVDSTGTVRIPFDWDWVDEFSEGLAVVGKKGKAGYITKNGILSIPCSYDEAETFQNGLAVVMNNNLYGLIDRNGNGITHTLYDDIGDFSQGLAPVKRNNRYGYVDETGNEVIPCKFEKAGAFAEGFAAVADSGRYGYINRNGEVVIPFQWQWCENFTNGVARVRTVDGYGLLTSTGQLVLPCTYALIGNFSENGLAIVVQNDLFGYARRDGFIAVPIKYPYNKATLGDNLFRDGSARIILDGKLGLIDSTGKTIVPRIHEDIHPLSEGLIAVQKKGKWGYLDALQKVTIPYTYAYAWPFQNGLARVRNNGSIGLIDHTGKEIIPISFSDATDCIAGYVQVQDSSGRWGLMNCSGAWILPCRYNRISWEDASVVHLEFGDQVSYYNVRKLMWIWREEEKSQ
jgi:hypothetical protein